MGLLVFLYRFDTPVYYMSKAKDGAARMVLEKVYNGSFINQLEVYDI